MQQSPSILPSATGRFTQAWKWPYWFLPSLLSGTRLHCITRGTTGKTSIFAAIRNIDICVTQFDRFWIKNITVSHNQFTFFPGLPSSNAEVDKWDNKGCSSGSYSTQSKRLTFISHIRYHMHHQLKYNASSYLMMRGTAKLINKAWDCSTEPSRFSDRDTPFLGLLFCAC